MAPQGEAPHIDGVFPMEDYHPANPIINANSSSVDSSSLATNASIGTTADLSTTSLIGGVPLSLVDPAITSLTTDVSMTIDLDHSAAPPINVAHTNGDPDAQLPGTMSTAVTVNPLVVTLDNPLVSTTQMLFNISAAHPKVTEKGPTGMTKKAGIMRPNCHSKTAR